ATSPTEVGTLSLLDALPISMGGRRYLAVCTGLALAVTPAVLPAQGTVASAAAESLIIRTDDIGMSHSVNMAMERLVGTGLPVSVDRKSTSELQSLAYLVCRL